MNPKTKTFNREAGKKQNEVASDHERRAAKNATSQNISHFFVRAPGYRSWRPSKHYEKNASRTRENQCQIYAVIFIPNLPLASFCSINIFYEANGDLLACIEWRVRVRCTSTLQHTSYRCLVRPAATWLYRYHRNGRCSQKKSRKKWWQGRNIEKNEQQIKLNGRKK